MTALQACSQGLVFMNYIQAIILGIVQGLTEFIPISSTAHLVFASRWTNIYNGDPQQITATMAIIQLGTVAAVILFRLRYFEHCRSFSA